MSGYVYLIGSKTFNWYKIGKSVNPDIRVRDIGILLPFKVSIKAIWRTDNHSVLEASLHEKYAEHNIHGEWFEFKPSKVHDIVFGELRHLDCIYPADSKSRFSNFSNLDTESVPEQLRGIVNPETHKKYRNKIARLMNLLNDAQAQLNAANKKMQRLEGAIELHNFKQGQPSATEAAVKSGKLAGVPTDGAQAPWPHNKRDTTVVCAAEI